MSEASAPDDRASIASYQLANGQDQCTNTHPVDYTYDQQWNSQDPRYLSCNEFISQSWHHRLFPLYSMALPIRRRERFRIPTPDKRVLLLYSYARISKARPRN